MKEKMIVLALAICSLPNAFAQTIQVDLPKFAGKSYAYVLDRGYQKDTIAKGKLDMSGKQTLIIPDSKKGYKGLSHLLLEENTSFDLIVNNENFSVVCTEETPGLENTTYKGSAENDFLKANYLAQKSIVEKATLMGYILNVYKKEEPAYPAFQKEQENLNLQFTTLKKEREQSQLYAAQFLQIFNFLTGLGSSLEIAEEAKANEMNIFVRDKMNIEALYTSGYWNDVIHSWVQMQNNVIKNDAVCLSDVEKILSRIKNNTLYTNFAEKLVYNFAKIGKDNLVSSVGQYVAKSGRVESPNNNLQMAMKEPFNGSPAPALQIGKTKKTIKGKTVVFFFESGCNNCENEIHQLIGNYQAVKDKGYEIITVSADMTPYAGDGHDHTFPWKEQICDYKGLTGINFKNFGVMGTPTFFVIDENGKLKGNYARFIDTGILAN